MFGKVSRGLSFSHETIILVWWLRFERTLLIAERQPPNCKKRIKSLIKELLKEERHRFVCFHFSIHPVVQVMFDNFAITNLKYYYFRNNLPLYVEYALLEKELNQSDIPCLKILETALLMHPLKKNVFYISSMRNSFTQLYRVTVEVLLLSGNRYVIS